MLAILWQYLVALLRRRSTLRPPCAWFNTRGAAPRCCRCILPTRLPARVLIPAFTAMPHLPTTDACCAVRHCACNTADAALDYRGLRYTTHIFTMRRRRCAAASCNRWLPRLRRNCSIRRHRIKPLGRCCHAWHVPTCVTRYRCRSRAISVLHLAHFIPHFFITTRALRHYDHHLSSSPRQQLGSSLPLLADAARRDARRMLPFLPRVLFSSPFSLAADAAPGSLTPANAVCGSFFFARRLFCYPHRTVAVVLP